METGYVDAMVRQGSEHSVLRQLRQSGWIPAVLYGGGQAPANISVPERSLEANVRESKKFVELTVDGQTVLAMIHDLQTDPLTKRITHADFYRVNENQMTETEVPIHLHGVQQAQRHGCIVQQQLRTIAVRAMPKNTPEYISVDVSSLEAGQHLTVGDIVLPQNVELRSDEREVLVSALAHSQVVVLEETPAEVEPTV